MTLGRLGGLLPGQARGRIATVGQGWARAGGVLVLLFVALLLVSTLALRWC